MLATVWGASGLDRIRPTNAEEALLLHTLFSIFGSLHWPEGASRLHASPVVDGNDDARRVVEWARNVYEQLTLYWVSMATDICCEGIFHIYSGEGGMMVNQHLHVLPQVNLDVCLQCQELPHIFHEFVKPEDWKIARDNLYIFLLQNDPMILRDLTGQWQFPGTFHAFGKVKRKFQDIGSLILSYELSLRKVFFLQHANLTDNIDVCIPEIRARLQISGDTMGYDSHAMVNGLQNQMCTFYHTQHCLTTMKKGWCTVRHSDSFHEHVTLTSSQPRHIVIYCSGAGNQPPDP